MVRLRLRRKGAKHHPVYDIVVVDQRAKRDGAFLERLGYYDPNTNPSTYKINHDRAIYWLGVGAQPTLVVHNLMSYDGVLLRRQLQFKGKSAEEIEESVTKHKEIALARYARRKDLRKKRIIAKKKAEAAGEENTEAAAK
ncbi:MAG: 30S ribosomal protein S16 [Ignavibacteria bacterium GWF2_33_9]|nr:MAG: 30S ribosomal protein S16 [Ignavibacteria bacterium GWF2_33_9]